jgi:hypothetical protein
VKGQDPGMISAAVRGSTAGHDVRPSHTTGRRAVRAATTALEKVTAAHPNLRGDHVILEPVAGWPGATGLLSTETIDALLRPLDGRDGPCLRPKAMDRDRALRNEPVATRRMVKER